jgi:hypothetical protein
MYRFILLIIYLFTFSSLCFSQKINRYKHKEKHGRWIIYHDSASKQIDNNGRYRKGLPKGTWKYYDPKGHLIKKEKHIFKKINIVHYHPNGKPYKKGKAKTVVTDELIHYFYYGDWLVYDTSGNLVAKQFYKEGNRISEKLYQASSETKLNDSLIAVIRRINTEIYKYTDSILDAESKYGKNSKEYQRYISLSNLNALKIFDEIDRIILKHGYPGRTLVGNDNTIVFSIISTAGLKYKEKYYDLIINAADKKELNWSDVAYFVDKVKVARKEKQLYGTQYKIEGNKLLHYPIENKATMNNLRKKAGLEEIDPAGLNDIAEYN